MSDEYLNKIIYDAANYIMYKLMDAEDHIKVLLDVVDEEDILVIQKCKNSLEKIKVAITEMKAVSEEARRRLL